MNAPVRFVYVEQSDCTSCQLCAEELPLVFSMDSEELSFVHDPFGASEDEIQESMEACPGECIHWKGKE